LKASSDAGIFMLNAEKKSITQALFVIGFERDFSIRTRQFDIENVLQPLVKSPSINTNLPDDFNPTAPRVTLGREQVSVHFSQIAAQLTINVDNTNGKPLEVIQDSIIKRVNLFQNCVDKIIPREQQRERGLVLTVKYPVDSTKFNDEAVFKYIQSRFLRVTPLGAPASAGFNVGYKTEDNFFATLSVADYKMVSSEIPAMSTSQWLDFYTLPVIESGIELKIDINSRPMVGNIDQPVDVTSSILKKSFNFALAEADKFMGIE
jgi:hypothetical protein